MQQGEANMVIRQLTRRCGDLTSDQVKKCDRYPYLY